MEKVNLWLPEEVTIQDAEGNIYSGINHIESGDNGYVETYDGEVYLFSDMDARMLAEVEQLIDDYDEV